MLTRVLGIRKLPRKRFYMTSRPNIWNRDQISKNSNVAVAAKSLVEEYSSIFKIIEENYLILDGRVNFYYELAPGQLYYDGWERHILKQPHFIFPQLKDELLVWWTRTDIPQDIKFERCPKIETMYTDDQIKVTFGQEGKRHFIVDHEFVFTRIRE